MSLAQLRIEANLLNIIKSDSFDDFTVISLRNEYMRQSDNQDAKSVRNFVYSQILRLSKWGLLAKNEPTDTGRAFYSKTSLFKQTELIPYGSVRGNQSNKKHDYIKRHKLTRSNIRHLKKKLNRYQVELLSSIGESEEYMRLFESRPELKEVLESKYLIAREQSSKILGKIKALKSVLSSIEGELHCN